MKKAYQFKFEDLEFYIDEDARSVLFEFIETSEKQFQKIPEYQIQWESFKRSLKNRFMEYVTDPKKIISLEILEKIIHEISNEFSVRSNKKGGNNKKPLYRNTTSSVLGGVCSGLADRFSVDTTIVRVLFILGIFTGVGIFVYIALWIVIPPNDKKEKFHSNAQSARSNSENALVVLFRAIGTVIVGVLKGISSILGLVFLFIIIFFILVFFNIMPWHSFPDFHFWSGHSEINRLFYEINQDKVLFLLCLAILIIIPVFSILIALVKTIFGVKGKDQKLKFALFLLWFLCLLGLIGILVSNNDTNRDYKTTTKYNNLEQINSSVIYIEKINNIDHLPGSVSDDHKLFKYGHFYTHGQKYLYGTPEIKIVRTESNNIHSISIKKDAAFDFNKEHGYLYSLDRIEYTWLQNDSLIKLDRYFLAEDMKWWNFPKVTIEIIIPRHKDIMFVNPGDHF